MSVENKDKEQKDNEEYSKNFARIPNMVFASYKYLTKEEKFLYCSLKSIYWDAKPRFVSLRDLGIQTEYSPGALKKMLPRLHICGLIHAEIKREKGTDGKEKGNAKYNITMLDIWELNRAYYSCSPNERVKLDPSIKLVQENTQGCSPNDTSLFTKSDKPVHQNTQENPVKPPVGRAKTPPKERRKTSLRKEERGDPPATASDPGKEISLSPSSSNADKDMAQEENTPTNSLLDSLTEEQVAFWQRWCAISKHEYEKINQTAIEHIIWLAERLHTTEEIQSCYDYAYARIREIPREAGRRIVPPALGNLRNCYPDWAKSHELKEREKSPNHASSGTVSYKNSTYERLASGKPVEPIVYNPLPVKNQRRSAGNITFVDMPKRPVPSE